MLDTFEALDTPSSYENPGIVPTGLALPTRTLEPGQTLYEADRDASSLYVVNHGGREDIEVFRVGDRASGKPGAIAISSDACTATAVASSG